MLAPWTLKNEAGWFAQGDETRPELEEHERISLSRWRPWMVLYAAVHAGFTVACHCHSFAIRSVFERSLNPHTKNPQIHYLSLSLSFIYFFEIAEIIFQE